MSEIATWAREDTIIVNLGFERVERKVADHELIDRLFYSWDRSSKGALSLQDIVIGLDSIIGVGLMESIEVSKTQVRTFAFVPILTAPICSARTAVLLPPSCKSRVLPHDLIKGRR